jgi:hypothetical protein
LSILGKLRNLFRFVEYSSRIYNSEHKLVMSNQHIDVTPNLYLSL